MPLDRDLRSQLRSSIADIKHVGTRDGGTITAAAFLKNFVNGSSWAHLDIAGTSYLDKADGYRPQGGTGVGVAVSIGIVDVQTRAYLGGSGSLDANTIDVEATLDADNSYTVEAKSGVGDSAKTGVAGSLGASAEVEYRHGYPPTVNSEKEAEFAARVGERIFGPTNVIRDADPTMGGEDFSYMLLERPGAYVWLGQGGGPLGCSLHNANYDFNDAVIPLGAGYLAALVEDALPLT